MIRRKWVSVIALIIATVMLVGMVTVVLSSLFRPY